MSSRNALASRQNEWLCILKANNIQRQVSVFLTPSPSRTSLTVGSTRTSMLRIAAG
jgi:hypothetical protein